MDTAKLYLDGKLVAEVSNHGHGAPDEQYWHDREAEKKIYAHFAALPKQEVSLGGGRSFMCQPELDSWCADELGIYLAMKQITGLTSKKVVLFKGAEIHTLKFDPKNLDRMSPRGKTYRAEIAEKHTGFEIANDLKGPALRAKLLEIGAVSAPTI